MEQKPTNKEGVISKDESAYERVRKSLHSVKVHRFDADEVQRKLEGELFDNWSEKCEVMSAKQIRFDNLKNYIDHLHESYEGIDHDVKKKLYGVLFVESAWDYRLIEWKFNKGDESGARYGMIAFGRSRDQKYVDCMYVLYKMDFKVAPTRIVTQKTHKWLFGLFQYTTEKVHLEERTLGATTIQSMQNFFRFKALQGFYNEGLIDSINYVQSLEDVPVGHY